MGLSKSGVFAAAHLLAFATGIFAQQSPIEADRAARLTWLKDHAIALKSIDPKDEDFSDLQPLRNAIGDSRIVQLGEQSHGDGATFHAKARLIKFLHQEMGFDVLAFESGLYDCRKAWELLREGKEPYEAATYGVFGIWTGSEQFQSVIDYLGKWAKTDRPLELCGFDCQLTAGASKTHLKAEVTKIPDQLGESAVSAETRAALFETLAAMSKRPAKPSALETVATTLKIAKLDKEPLERQQKALAAFGQALASVQPSNSFSAKDIVFWRQYALSLSAEAEKQWTFQADMYAGVRLRDAQMAKNLVWLASEVYPRRKIIVWAASSHLMRNPTTVQPLNWSLLGNPYRSMATMGDGIWKELGTQTYTLAFVAAEGEAGHPTTQPRRLPPAERESLEDLMVAAGHTNAIVDFRHLDPSGAWLREKLPARPLGYIYTIADWTNVFDGIVFTRTMYPSTLAARARLQVPPQRQILTWWIGPRKGSGDYESGIDLKIKHDGNSSAYLKSVSDEPSGFGNLVQAFAADAYRGKRLRMTAFVKAEDVQGAAGLWMRVDGQALTAIAFDNMQTRPIKGTNDWQSHEVVLDLPEEAVDVSFGILVRGKGQVWVDDFKFEPVGADVATTAIPIPRGTRPKQTENRLPKEPRNLDFES